MRAQHGAAYNIAPLKWLLKTLYNAGNGEARPRFMNLLPADEKPLGQIAEAVAAVEKESGAQQA